MDVREKIRASQEKLNAVVTIIEKSEPIDGPLKGLPIAVKDNFSTKGVLTTGGSKILDNYVPVYDATAIERLKKAGADLVCKVNMDELSMGGTGINSCFGPVRNPYNPERMTGGSSSGSAALVGARIVDFALGTDTGDSVRKPAANCGCIGFKPTYGLISRYGVLPYAGSLDHVGIFTRRVEDVGLLLNVLAGRDDKDLTSLYVDKQDYTDIDTNLEGKVFGVIDEVLENKTDDEYKKQYTDLLEKLEKKGATIKRFSIDKKLLNTLSVTYHIIANCEATSSHANLDGIRFGHRVEGEDLTDTITKSRTLGFGTLLKRRYIVGAYFLDENRQEEYFKKAQRVRRLIVEEYTKILEACDAVILPTGDSVANKISNIDTVTNNTEKTIINNHLILGNFAGNPSISLPLGFVDGLPTSVNLSGKVLDDKNLLALSKEVEKVIDFESKDREVNPWII